jgi:VWFA-related protein
MVRNFVRFLLSALISVPFYAAAQSAQAGQETTIRTTADLVVVDVTVSDAQQNPVHHLGATDFTVLEDGHPQAIKVFEEHAASAPAPMPPIPKLDPGTFTNYSPVPVNSAIDILLFDKLNTPMNAQTEVRNEVLKFLRETPAGARIAIFSLTTELKLLQGFTSDPSVLRALVEGKKDNQSASSLMSDALNGDQPGADDEQMMSMEAALGNMPNKATVLANLKQFEAEQQSHELQLRARFTLDALNLLARYMSNLPGRKNLIWFSGSFPISILPDPSLQNPFAVVASSEDEFRETVDLMARSQVAVYPIDARGLMVEPMLNASNSGRADGGSPGDANRFTLQTRGGRDTLSPNDQPTGDNETMMGQNAIKFFRQTAEEHDTMEQMAEATGGKAFMNANNLKAAVEKAIDVGSNYYTIAYSPTNHNWNGSYRRIEVKVDQPKVALAYRRGYFADDPSTPARHTEVKSEKNALPPYDAMRAAMLRGAPDPTQIVFAANVRLSTDDEEPAVAPGNEAANKFNGPYRRYTVEFRVSPRSIDCAATPDGKHHCTLDFASILYDVDGALLNSQTNSIRVNLSSAQFASALNSFFSYRQQISVPVKGEYYLRVGLRDAAADRVGALELPVAEVARLKPIAAQGEASAPAAPPK